MNLAHQRLAAQRLVGPAFPTIDEAVRAQCAVQAQDYPGAAWGIGQRVAGTTLSDVNEALAAGTILRTHVLRPTWHLVSPIDIRWLLQLTGPRVVAGAASRYRNLELDTRTLARSADIVERELGGGRHRTRTELGAALAEAGIEANGGRLAHILMHAELTALVCSGAPRGAQQTYALLDERAPSGSPLDRDEALVRLAERFARAHSPFRDVDLAWWGGVSLGDVRRGLGGSDLGRQTIGEHEYWSSLDVPEVEPRPTIHLLPNFDEYVVAYRDRTHVFDGETIAARTFLRDYLSSHLVVGDGRAIGRWRRPAGGRTDIQVELFAPLGGSDSRLETALGEYKSFSA